MRASHSWSSGEVGTTAPPPDRRSRFSCISPDMTAAGLVLVRCQRQTSLSQSAALCVSALSSSDVRRPLPVSVFHPWLSVFTHPSRSCPEPLSTKQHSGFSTRSLSSLSTVQCSVMHRVMNGGQSNFPRSSDSVTFFRPSFKVASMNTERMPSSHQSLTLSVISSKALGGATSHHFRPPVLGRLHTDQELYLSLTCRYDSTTLAMSIR